MKRHQKITLASLGVMVGILAGVLTVVEKSIHIISDLKPQASEVPKGVMVEQGVAGRVDKFESKQTAKSSFTK